MPSHENENPAAVKLRDWKFAFRSSLEHVLETCASLELNSLARLDLQRSLRQRIDTGTRIATRYRERAEANQLYSDCILSILVANLNGFARFLNGSLDRAYYGAQCLFGFRLGCSAKVLLDFFNEFSFSHVC